MCEDAPCCGCCGPLLDAADDLAAMERAYDGEDFDDFFDGPLDEDEEDEDADYLIASGDVVIASVRHIEIGEVPMS